MIELTDVRVLVDHEGWGRDAVAARVTNALDLVRQELERVATTRLGSTAKAFARSIGQPVVKNMGDVTVGTVSLGGPGTDAGEVALARMLEEGAPPYDLRPGLLPGRGGSRPAKVSKAGHMYRAIPFRHDLQQAGHQYTKHGRRPEQTAHRGNLSERAARQLGASVRAHAGGLKPTRTSPDPGTKTAWGGRIDAGLAALLRPRHVVDVFAGMVRQEKTYERATQSQHVTFRMISTNPGTHRFDTQTRRGGGHPAGPVNVMGATAEKNWTHPGFAPRRIFEAGAEYLAKIVGSPAFAELGGPHG